jgi:hypothetical protein
MMQWTKRNTALFHHQAEVAHLVPLIHTGQMQELNLNSTLTIAMDFVRRDEAACPWPCDSHFIQVLI